MLGQQGECVVCESSLLVIMQVTVVGGGRDS